MNATHTAPNVAQPLIGTTGGAALSSTGRRSTRAASRTGEAETAIGNSLSVRQPSYLAADRLNALQIVQRPGE
jgi:hypothetical protein